MRIPPAPQGTLQSTAPAPAPAAVSGALPLNVARPMTRSDVLLLQNRKSELSRQLTSASGRRRDVVSDMNRSVNGKEGLAAHLKVLDERIVQLEQDIAQNGQLLASAPPNLVEETTPSPSFPQTGRAINLTGVSIVFTVAVLMPLSLAWARRLQRRWSQAPALPPESVDRLVRIETAVDSIAVEVERISEGQRFVTRLMNETHRLGDGSAQPMALRQGEPEPRE